MFFSKLVMFVPLLIVMFLDLTFTIIGQPRSYWENYDACHEGSPVGRLFLSMGPEIFLVSFWLYICSSYALISRLKSPFDSMIILMLFLGHAWGSASWLQILFSMMLGVELDRWYLHIFYFMLVSIICGTCSWNIKKHPDKGKV